MSTDRGTGEFDGNHVGVPQVRGKEWRARPHGSTASNKSGAAFGRLSAAFELTGLIANGAWGRISYREHTCAWRLVGLAGSAPAGAL